MQEICLERTYSWKVSSIDWKLKKDKVFYRLKIPEFSSVQKETVDIDIHATSRNGDKKIIQSIRITSRLSSRIRKWNKLSQFTVRMKIYQSNTYKKDLRWLNFDGKPCFKSGSKCRTLHINFCSLSNISK